jgi:pyridoxal/pyridoxine/pyridoxamine kinase
VFEATRRVEQARTDRQPDWAALVRGYAGNAASARAVLDWVERWYDPSPAMVEAIRGLLAR